MNSEIQKNIFLKSIEENDKFRGFCELINYNSQEILKILNNYYEINLSTFTDVDFSSVDKENLVINLDTSDSDALMNLNMCREWLDKNFKKIILISKDESITNSFLFVAKDLFSRIQHHLELKKNYKYSYLENNPDYYINGGDEILTNLSIINNEIELIKENLFLLSFKREKDIFKFKKDFLDLGYIRIFDSGDSYLVDYSKINDAKDNNFTTKLDFSGKSFGKLMYISLGVETYKNGKILYSDLIYKMSDEAKYMWNSLVNLGLSEYIEDEKRFRMINNMLEDYFLDNKKNSD